MNWMLADPRFLHKPQNKRRKIWTLVFKQSCYTCSDKIKHHPSLGSRCCIQYYLLAMVVLPAVLSCLWLQLAVLRRSTELDRLYAQGVYRVCALLLCHKMSVNAWSANNVTCYISPLWMTPILSCWAFSENKKIKKSWAYGQVNTLWGNHVRSCTQGAAFCKAAILIFWCFMRVFL